MSDVSVIIPTIRPDSLEAALASVHAQTEPPREVIVIEDTEREGAAVARNRGAGRAKGAFYAFLDDDDRWDPRFLERVRVPEGCPMAFSPLPRFPGGDPQGDSPTVPSAAVIRAEAFYRVGGFRRLYLAEDYDLFLRLSRLGALHRGEPGLVEYGERDRPREHWIAMRVYTAAVLEDFRAAFPGELNAAGRRALAREYGLLAKTVHRWPGASKGMRRFQRAAAAHAFRLRPRLRHLIAWCGSFRKGTGERAFPLPPPPEALHGLLLPLLYDPGNATYEWRMSGG